MEATAAATQSGKTLHSGRTPAQQAFLASGLDIHYVARVVNLSPDYLKTQLRTGCRCYVTAERLRRVLNCPVEFFLPKPKSKQSTKPTTKERGRATRKDRVSEQQRAKSI